MGCVRKRGNSWNAQVRISGWRSFTKTFQTKLDASATNPNPHNIA